MPLLDIKQVRKVTVTCSLEESTAIQVDQYAAFVKCLPDEVVNKALEYTFGKDSDFQKFRSTASAVESKTIKLGMSPDEVKRSLGNPDKIVDLGAKQVYIYKDMKVVFLNSQVSDVQ